MFTIPTSASRRLDVWIAPAGHALMHRLQAEQAVDQTGRPASMRSAFAGQPRAQAPQPVQSPSAIKRRERHLRPKVRNRRAARGMRSRVRGTHCTKSNRDKKSIVSLVTASWREPHAVFREVYLSRSPVREKDRAFNVSDTPDSTSIESDALGEDLEISENRAPKSIFPSPGARCQSSLPSLS